MTSMKACQPRLPLSSVCKSGRVDSNAAADMTRHAATRSQESSSLLLTFAGADVVEVQLVALLGSLQGALGGKEVAGGVVGLVVVSADLKGGKKVFLWHLEVTFVQNLPDFSTKI